MLNIYYNLGATNCLRTMHTVFGNEIFRGKTFTFDLHYFSVSCLIKHGFGMTGLLNRQTNIIPCAYFTAYERFLIHGLCIH